MKRNACAYLRASLVLIAWHSVAAAELTPAFSPREFDMTVTRAVVDGKEVSRPTKEALGASLCGESAKAVWSTGKHEGLARHFIVGFLKPVRIGTIYAPDYPGTTKIPLQSLRGFFVSALKTRAPYPGDPENDEHWQLLIPGAVKYLPRGTTTRALRFSQVHARAPWPPGPWESSLGNCLCLRERYYSALDVGGIARRRNGEKSEHVFASWSEALPVSGVLFNWRKLSEGMELSTAIDILNSGTSRPALGATVEDWDRLERKNGGPASPFAFDAPRTTRGIRIDAPRRGGYRALKSVAPLVPLGELDISPGARQEPPFKVPFIMPMSGFAAIDIHEKRTQKRVRRLIAETAHDRGEVFESWDLRDDDGGIVSPGDYTWRGIARPPFKLTYEMTLYNAGEPGWRAPPPQGRGGGMWLADHVPPQCAAAQGEIMWLGTGCTENGHCLIATDLEGKKLWGTGHIAEGFRGPSRIAADDRCVYGITNTIIYRVDPRREFKGREVYTIESTVARPWNVGESESDPARGGLAARDGRLYCAINLPSRWLKSSFIADTMDPDNCEPIVRLYRNGGRQRENEKTDKVYGYGRYDELQSFYSAFLTERTPKETLTFPDRAIVCNGEAYFGDAPSEGKNRGRLVASFKKPITVGSILIPDGAIRVQVLKSGTSVAQAITSAEGAGGHGGITLDETDDADDGLGDLLMDIEDDESGEDGLADSLWITLENAGGAGKPTVALAPPGGLKTRAIRYKTPRLSFSQVMSRRLKDIAAEAERVFTEGELTSQGGVWVTRKGGAFSQFQPATMALRWRREHDIRGLSLMRVGEGEHRPHLPTQIAVDTWTGGNADVAAALHDDSRWSLVSQFEIPEDATLFQADFGDTIRASAVRVRCLNGRRASQQQNTYVSGFHGIVAYEPAGDDPADLPANMNQRIAVLKLPAADDDEGKAQPIDDIPLPQPNALAFDGNGVLHCMSAGQIVTVPLTPAERSRVVVSRNKLASPVHFTFGPRGRIYVSDKGPKAIKVFDPDSGEQLRVIGTPGGPRPGKWDPMKLENPTQVAVDRDGKVWVADLTYSPKRIMVFDSNGNAHKWFLGPTQYGGGGSMDPRDRSIVMYNGMKFRIDWETRTWKLDALLGHDVERAVYHRGKRYIVGPFPGPRTLTMITMERNDVAVPIVVAGQLSEWAEVANSPALRAKLSDMDPDSTSILWSDRNGDERPQPDEVQVRTDRGSKQAWDVGEDLTIFSLDAYGGDGLIVRPSSFTRSGVPLYDFKQARALKTYARAQQTRRAWGDDRGRFFMIGTRLIDSDGKTMLWEYLSPYTRHDGFYSTGFGYERPPGVLNQEHWTIGHFTVGDEEFYVNNSDPGDWYCYTADGMLVGCLFGGSRGYGLRSWPATWDAGKTELVDLRLGQEHYQGCVVKADDGNVYAVAGHNHMSIVRIDGLEELQRLAGSVTVSHEDISLTRRWQELEDRLAAAREEPRVAKLLRAGFAPAISGTLEEWPTDLFVTIGETVKPGLNETLTYLDARAAIGYDADNLYFAIQVRDESPLRNAAQDPKTLFKGGDAAELTLGVDVEADPKRLAPVAGDLRLLFSVVGSQPVAVLYKPVDAGAPAEARTKFVSPVGQTRMDRVEVLTRAKVAAQHRDYKTEEDGVLTEGTYWELEAAVSWQDLGVDVPEPGTTIRGDFGYLQSDEHGMRTVGRKYWSGRTQTVVSDTPSEARLAPSLWGEFVVTKPSSDLRFDRPVIGTEALDEQGFPELGDEDEEFDALEELGE